MEVVNISFKTMKKQILLLTAVFVFTLVLCGAVSAADQCDLTISGNVNHIPPARVYAVQSNNVMVNIINNGPDSSPATKVNLYASDVSSTVPVAWSSVPSLTSGNTNSVTLIDPTLRPITANTVYGSASPSYVTYTVKIDPDNTISETDENNNIKTSEDLPVYYNGYGGKRYEYNGVDVTGSGINDNTGGDIKTTHTYDLKGGVVYYTQPSSYKSVGWSTRTETWTASNLPIPSTGTVQDVWLYLSYNWDTTSGGRPNWTVTFNGHDITNSFLAWYTDQANAGTYAYYKYGLYVFNVNSLFNENGDNIMTMTPGSGNSNAIYPSTLAVIYQDPNAIRKQIFINEQCDELGVSLQGTYVNPAECAIAYAPFTGMSISTGNVNGATLYSFVGSAGPNEGNLIFNGNTIASNAWQGTSSTASAFAADVKNSLLNTGNMAGIQATTSGGMVVLQQFLVVEYNQVISNLKVNSVNPADNTTINIKNKVIEITFNENVKEGSAYGDIKVTGPSGIINMTKSISGKVLSLTPVSEFADGNYNLNLPVNSLSDLADHGLTSAFTSKFTVDATAPVVSSIDPVKDAIININNKPISITFSEDIQAGSAYNNITITGSVVNFTKSINGKVLTLTSTSTYSDGTYTITLPANAVKDSAGNGLAAYSSKFTVTTSKLTATASPKGGYYNIGKSVALSMNVPGDIYYTIDGTTPTIDSAKYSKALSISSSVILKFLAVDKAGNFSPVYTEKYVIDKKAPTASATPNSGSYKNTIKVTLKMSETGTIYYTINGATPTTKSSKYSKPFYLSTSKTLKYLAVDLAGNKSPVYTKKYTIKDTTAPKISSIQPANSATKVPVNQIIKITFSEPIKTGTTFNSISVKNSSGKSVTITKSISSNVLTIKLTKGTYTKNTKYTITIPAKAVRDTVNNSLSTSYKASFTTTKT